MAELAKNDETFERMVTLLVKEENFRVSAYLLKKESPVFSRIIEGNWKESNDSVIKIEAYAPLQVKLLVECLHQSQMDSVTSVDYVVFNHLLIRNVLPLVQYYEIETLKKRIFDVPLTLIAAPSLIDKSYLEKMVIRAVMAIEANCNSSDVPDWPKDILAIIFRDLMQQDWNLSFQHGEVNFDELTEKTFRAGFKHAKKTWRGFTMKGL